MVKLELSVPSSLESIELRQYQKYMGVVESNEDVENAEDFLNMKLVEIFCDVSLKDVSSIELQDFEKITDIIGKAFAEKTPLIRHFKLGDTEFGFVPNLDKISIGEYIDIEANIVDWKTAHKAMAVLFRPITKKRDEKYQIEEYEGSTVYSDALRYMPLNIAMGAMVFFYHLGKDLLNHTLKALEEDKKVNSIIQQELLSEKNGGGISQYINSLEEMQQKLIRQLK